MFVHDLNLALLELVDTVDPGAGNAVLVSEASVAVLVLQAMSVVSVTAYVDEIIAVVLRLLVVVLLV